MVFVRGVVQRKTIDEPNRALSDTDIYHASNVVGLAIDAWILHGIYIYKFA